MKKMLEYFEENPNDTFEFIPKKFNTKTKIDSFDIKLIPSIIKSL